MLILNLGKCNDNLHTSLELNLIGYGITPYTIIVLCSYATNCEKDKNALFGALKVLFEKVLFVDWQTARL